MISITLTENRTILLINIIKSEIFNISRKIENIEKFNSSITNNDIIEELENDIFDLNARKIEFEFILKLLIDRLKEVKEWELFIQEK